MTRADTVIGAGLTIAFLAMAWASTGLTYMAEFAPGPGFAPFWFGLVGAALSAYVAARGLTSPAAPAGSRSGVLRLATAVGALVLAMAAVPSVGFFVALCAYLLVVTLGIERLRPVIAVASVGGTVLLIYVVFASLLDVPFPKGPLGF